MGLEAPTMQRALTPSGAGDGDKVVNVVITDPTVKIPNITATGAVRVSVENEAVDVRIHNYELPNHVKDPTKKDKDIFQVNDQVRMVLGPSNLIRYDASGAPAQIGNGILTVSDRGKGGWIRFKEVGWIHIPSWPASWDEV